MGGERHAGEVGEGRHQRGGAGFDGGAEGGKVDLGKGAIRDLDGGVVAARHAGAVGGEMLRGGGEAGEALALEAAHLGLREPGGDEGVLAGALGDPTPARVAGDIEHRREGEVDAGGGGLPGGASGGRLPERGVEGARLREGDREDGAKAVQDVEPEEERDTEAASPRPRGAGAERTASRPQRLKRLPTRPERTRAATSSTPVGPVTVRPAVTMANWPIFSVRPHPRREARRPTARAGPWAARADWGRRRRRSARTRRRLSMAQLRTPGRCVKLRALPAWWVGWSARFAGLLCEVSAEYFFHNCPLIGVSSSCFAAADLISLSPLNSCQATPARS